MPRETIYQRDQNGPLATNGEQLDSGRGVQVAWFRDEMHISIGLVWDTGLLFETDEGKTAFRSLHVELTNRNQVNDMIRYLRKARDQAFGQDA